MALDTSSQPCGSEAGPTKVSIGRLLQESRQLNARIRAGTQDTFFLPQLQRGLEQIEELSSYLATQVSAERVHDSKAALFLASRGYDATLMASRLNKVADIVPGEGATTTTAATTTMAFEPDVDTFLANDMDNIMMEMLARVDSLVVREAERIVEARRAAAWDKTRSSVIEKTSGAPGALVEAIGTGPKAAAYTKVIRTFNDARLKGASFNLCKEFERELRTIESRDARGEMILDCWLALQRILGGGEDDKDNVFEVKDISKSYLAELKSPESKGWREQLVRGTRRFLEEGYMRFVDRTLAQYPRDALLGGRPSALERVRAFCEIKLKRLPPAELAIIEMANGSPIWLLLFSLIRCGLLNEALTVTQNMEHALQRSDPLFLSFLKAFVTNPSHVITGSLLSQLRAEYNQKMTLSPQDPYKLVLYKVLGRCDLARKNVPEVTSTSEDYLWLQFWLIQDDADAAASPYTLEDLQRTVTDFGGKHFDPKQNNPWLYFEILLLVGLFEKALEYLYQNRLVVDVVHFAAAFAQAGTLRLGKATDPVFFKGATGKTCVNLGMLLANYAKTLTKGDILDAVNYLLLLSLCRSGEYDQLCHGAVRDLILESGDFGSLLGDVRFDGTVMPGCLSQYARLMNLSDSRAFMDVITTAAAAKCDKEGRFREALQLYNLSNKYDRVMEVLCTRLSRAFVAPYVALENDELRRTTESILKYYLSQTHISSTLSAASRNTCCLLLQLLNLRRLYEDCKWSAALEVLLSHGNDSFLIPLEGDIGTISAAADRAREMPDALSMILPELLLLTMTVLVKRAEELRGFIGLDTGRVQQVELLKRTARNVMTYVGMLKLRIPQEIYTQLTRMQLSLN